MAQVRKALITVLIACAFTKNGAAEVCRPKPHHVFCDGGFRSVALRPCSPKENPCFEDEEEEEEPCITSFYPNDLCGDLRWAVGPWSDCKKNSEEAFDSRDLHLIIPEINFALGVSTRTVHCAFTLEGPDLQYWIVHPLNCERFLKLRRTKLCEFPKPRDCVVSESVLPSSCGYCQLPNRFHPWEVLVPPENGGKECPKRFENEICKITDQCRKNRGPLTEPDFLLKIGAWSDCISIHKNEEISNKTVKFGTDYFFFMLIIKETGGFIEEDVINRGKYKPQLGMQYRHIACPHPNNPTSCRDLDTDSLESPLDRVCVVNQDCKQIDFAGWEMTSIGCIGLNGKLWPNVYQRHNSILQQPMGYGKLCKPTNEILNEYENLEDCKKIFGLKISNWSLCSLSQKEIFQPVACGGGIQTRSISCMAKDYKPVDLSYCERFTEVSHPTVQSCNVPCPVNCVVGEWGPWSTCFPFNCLRAANNQGISTRTRQIITKMQHKGKECPHLEEVRRCNQTTCYAKKVTDWGPCIVQGGGCGKGYEQREYYCITSIGNTVHHRFCEPFGEKVERRNCTLPCPGTCAFSEWSEWSLCSCGFTRTRQKNLIGQNEEATCPHMLTESQYCEECIAYRYSSGPWKPCTKPRKVRHARGRAARGFHPDRSFQALEPSLHQGNMTRNVTCLNSINATLSDAFCLGLTKPVTHQECQVEEAEQCVMTPWSEYTTCMMGCESITNLIPSYFTSSASWKVRGVAKRVGKAACDFPIKLKPCFNNYSRCSQYSWFVGTWSSCVVPANKTCNVGYQTRDVFCQLESSNMAVSAGFCFDTFKYFPQLVKSCVTFCHRRKCVELDTEQTCDCDESQHHPKTDEEIEKEKCIVSSNIRTPINCQCGPFHTKTDKDWSSCILNSSSIQWSNGILRTELCGFGTWYKRHTCWDSKNRMTEPSFCDLTPPAIMSESCTIDCPVDCIVTDWSPWSSCANNCSVGFQTRHRRVVQPDKNLGRPCPYVAESRPCRFDCSSFQWNFTHWGRCDPFQINNHGCGPGSQRREVNCRRLDGNFQWHPAEDHWCMNWERPPDNRECTIYCPHECAYTAWSEWSRCDENCGGTRVRTKKVMREAMNPGLKCQDTTETEDCELNHNCFTYQWVSSSYGTCELPERAEQDCGMGALKRLAICERSDRFAVDQSFCKGKPIGFQTEIPCQVPCPIDCFLSEWSGWDKSHCSIGNAIGQQFRYRKILVGPNEWGRPCQPTSQTIPCPALVKYDWAISAWSPCKVDKGFDCGYGRKTRQVTCNYYETPVELYHCFSYLNILKNNDLPWLLPDDLNLLDRRLKNLETEMDCYAPCPGNNDCRMSEWSQWSTCYADFPYHENAHESDQQIVGVQSRSRVVLNLQQFDGEPCPNDNMVESRPCLATKRMVYKWDYDEAGEPVCRRSDGRIIIGPCDETLKPCKKYCSKDGFWICVRINCVCRDDIFPTATICKPISTPSTELSTLTRAYETTDNPNDISLTSLASHKKVSVAIAVVLFAMYSNSRH